MMPEGPARPRVGDDRLAMQVDLHYFVERAWSIIEPTQKYIDNWHIRTLCHLLEDVTAGREKRVVVNIPPGTMKTILISILWPCWEWTVHPELRYLTAAYSMDRTTKSNTMARTVLESDWYRSLFGAVIKTDENQKTRFETVQGGWRIASSIGGESMGLHPDRIIIDDPMDPRQSVSEISCETVNYWYDRAISPRGLTRDARILLVMQRLSENDLSAHLLALGGFRHVCFPMRFEPDRTDSLDVRTSAGELLWPALHSEERLRLAEIPLGPYGVAGQMQQRPAPEGGGLFKREWFKFCGVAPVGAQRVRGWDTAATEGGGDWTVGVLESMTADGKFFVEHVQRGQWGPDGVNQVMLATAKADGQSCAVREEREGGASGKAVISARLLLLRGFDYAEVSIGGNKVLRANPFRAQCEGGNVALVRTGDSTRDAWIEPYLSELCSFPVGRHDDQVDASSCAFNVLSQRQPAVIHASMDFGVRRAGGVSPWKF